MSGNTVDARDQVLIIFFWPAAFIASMRFDEALVDERTLLC